MAHPNLTCRKNILRYFIVLFSLSCSLLFINNIEEAQADASEENEYLLPTVVIATLVRNKAHSLPWFLGLIEKLDYPKNRISLW